MSCRQELSLLKGLEARPGKGSGNGERASGSAKGVVEVLSYLLLSAQLHADLTQALPQRHAGVPSPRYSINYLLSQRNQTRSEDMSVHPGPGAILGRTDDKTHVHPVFGCPPFVVMLKCQEMKEGESEIRYASLVYWRLVLGR
jgi:hypothetical protein